MMNSRTRRSPPRGRGSSRSLTEKWYQSCGSSLYDWISRAWNVNVSSWVSGRTKRRPLRSVTWKISGILSRPVASQSSTGVSSGREELLAADRVHLLADDLLDLAVDSPAERQVRPEPGADLADEAAAHEELVADRLGVGRILAQGRQEEL